MAYARLAIVRGEWQLDPDGVIRLYVRTTLELIDRNGDTQHVSAFAATGRRSNSTCSKPSSTFVCTSTQACDAVGRGYGQAAIPAYRQWLEPLTPDQNFHVLGELCNNSSPIMALIVLNAAIKWHVQQMEPGLVCITDAIETNQFDGQIIEILRRMKVGKCH